MAQHRDTTAAELYAESATREAREVPAWITALRGQAAGRVAIALASPRFVRFTCPKCAGFSVVVEGPRWRCERHECARAGDTLDLVSRSLHGAVYFRLQPAQRAEVRQWAEGFLAQRGAGVSTGPAEPA